MFAFKFLLAIIGINQGRAEEATSEDEKQVISLKQEEDKQQIMNDECSPACALNADCFQYSINFKQRYTECRCRDGFGEAGYWARDDGRRGPCEPVLGQARYHTWLPYETHDREYVSLVQPLVKNFSKAKKSRSVHRVSLALSSAIKNFMAVSSQPRSRFRSCMRKVNSFGVIIGSQRGTKYKSTMGLKNECSQWQRSWDSTWSTSLSAISRCYNDIVDFFFTKDRRQCISIHKKLTRKIHQFNKVR
ncbi:Oidioi.mRNA.OKI2018_I69.XSR.g15854.t1.cds [Oikopleura dioica]|uniref:Oidioi.mRNA.OKI2018_I69.XSR.g15854.t1.cds n=1 Tax=Oikopleura dioica TaxID=34765 RepID=A0ABN7SG34_OIKDI|nr:Oidioi.mRNA.OKI2018_I69.XSR.g15854.t1.cds [Oikopleura dioica]